MYNAHNVSLYLTETEEYAKALRLAKKEVANRPTPESYSLLAYSYFKMGNVEKALEIVESQIEGKTFEPGILLNAAEIYKAAGYDKKVIDLKQELLSAVYELGPGTKQDIVNLLENSERTSQLF
ncbi:hypothetical protein Q2T40_00605 [Winogradskyella maritima]|nr:hypothetical protein [Winogradskyella maritima]